MTTDSYVAATSLDAYYPSRDTTQIARLWTREKTLHDWADLGAASFFEGPGTNPTSLVGYGVDKLWLQVESGVTTSAGTVRAYAGGDPALVASWPAVAKSSYAAHLGVLGSDLDYIWTTSTSGDPGTGKVGGNSGTLASITQLNISKTGRDGRSNGADIATWDDVTSIIRGVVTLYGVAASATTRLALNVTGAVVDNSTYYSIPVTVRSAPASITAGQQMGVGFVASGVPGVDGASAIAVSIKETQTAAAASTIDPALNVVQTYGRAAVGDLGHAIYRRATVVEAANLAAFPGTGSTTSFYKALDTGLAYRWTGAAYVQRNCLEGAFKDAGGSWWRPDPDDGNVFRPEMFSACSASANSRAAVQSAIDTAIDRHLNSEGIFTVGLTNSYRIDSPLNVFFGTAGAFQAVTLKIVGVHDGYVALKRSAILLNYTNNAGFICHFMRNVVFEGFCVVGSSIAAPSYSQVIIDASSPWYNPTGALRDNPYSPHTAFAVDAFSAGVAAGDQYSGYTSQYGTSGSGSSMLTFHHMEFQGFTVGVMLSPSLGTQNNDFVSFHNCLWRQNKVCLSIGQSQNRIINLYNPYFYNFKIAVDCVNYGVGGTGPMPNLFGGGAIIGKHIFLATNNWANATTWEGLYCEGVGSLGSITASAGSPIIFTGCHFKLLNRSSINGPVPEIHFHTTGANVIFKACDFTHYTGLTRRMNFYNAQTSAPLVFENCHFDDWPMTKFRTAVFRNCTSRYLGAPLTLTDKFACYDSSPDILTVGAGGRDLTILPGGTIEFGVHGAKFITTGNVETITVSGSVAVTVPGNGTASFTVADPSLIQVGDVLTQSGTLTFDYMTSTGLDLASLGVGRVASVDSGTGAVTLDEVPAALTAGNYTFQLRRWPRIRARCLGDVTNGNADVINCTNIGAYSVGNYIKGTGIPAGTRVVGKSGTTLTLSKVATATNTGVELYDMAYTLRAISDTAAASLSGGFSGCAYKGDRVEKLTVTVDGNNMADIGQICTASGSTFAAATWSTMRTSTVSPAT